MPQGKNIDPVKLQLEKERLEKRQQEGKSLNLFLVPLEFLWVEQISYMCTSVTETDIDLLPRLVPSEGLVLYLWNNFLTKNTWTLP